MTEREGGRERVGCKGRIPLWLTAEPARRTEQQLCLYTDTDMKKIQDMQLLYVQEGETKI